MFVTRHYSLRSGSARILEQLPAVGNDQHTMAERRDPSPTLLHTFSQNIRPIYEVWIQTRVDSYTC